jgi:hypothetical protein
VQLGSVGGMSEPVRRALRRSGMHLALRQLPMTDHPLTGPLLIFDRLRPLYTRHRYTESDQRLGKNMGRARTDS